MVTVCTVDTAIERVTMSCKSLYTKRPFTPGDFYIRRSLQPRLLTQKPLHQKPFTPQAIRTKELLHQKHPASNDLKLSTPGTGTFYTLASEVSTPKNFTPNTAFTRNSAKAKVFEPGTSCNRQLYTRRPSRDIFCTPKNFFAKAL